MSIQAYAIPSADLSKVVALIEASKQDLRDVTGIDIGFLGDVVHDHPQLFEAAYQKRFPSLTKNLA